MHDTTQLDAFYAQDNTIRVQADQLELQLKN